MIIRFKRTFMAIAAIVFVAACSNVTELSRSDEEPSALNLNTVNVDASGLKQVSEGRAISRTRTQFERDLTAAITREASVLSDPDGLRVDVNVTVDKVYLAPLASRVVAGTSYIESTVSVTSSVDGSKVVAPTQVIGNSESLRAVAALGAVGALANANVETDYQNTLDGYAEALIASLQASSQQ